MLTITPLRDAEYLISSVALSVEEYYAGVGESPGVWAGRWAEGLGLSGTVEADELRALVEGRHPGHGRELLAGHRDRKVMAFDLTFSSPKSVSLLWALGSNDMTEVITEAHREAVESALGFLEERASVARRQRGGVRRQVATEGFVVAGFLHRTSREGDPQLHSHCLVPNLVERTVDGQYVAFDANPLHVWARAAGSIYQNELQRSLFRRLGVVWGPDRHNTREIAGFSRKQLQTFSKRSAQIEAELEREGARYESPALRMKADAAASLATRAAKDHSLTPALLLGQWQTEAAEVKLATGRRLERAVCYRERDLSPPGWQELVAALVDPELGLCARSARFTEADVVEHLCALSGGRLTLEEITEATGRFLSSELAVRLIPEIESGQRRRPPEWSTSAHRVLEDETLSFLDRLIQRPARAVTDEPVAQAVAAEQLGADQIAAVGVLTGPGSSVRSVLAPAGYGKTAMAHVAAMAAGLDGRPVVAVATTSKAVAELTEAGLPARTIAQLRIELQGDQLAPGTVVILDEVSQTSTRDAHAVVQAAAACRDAMVWVLGDPRQSRSVAAGGIADEIERLVAHGRIPAASLTVNRRQMDAADRAALDSLRHGHAAQSQQLRAEHGWEHEGGTPGQTRTAMAEAVCADVAAHGASQVVALTVSHADAEDLADRIRARLVPGGVLKGKAMVGPGWSTEREYRSGDRVLLHARCGTRAERLFNGMTATVERVGRTGLVVLVDDGRRATLPTDFVQGTRRDGSPNLSHSWVRTVDGAQGGTWQAAHLLGTSALDAYRGYTGQSRSRQPTHTWNVAKVPAVDHGGILAETRNPAEQVAAALDREPDPRLAARSDPYILERQLLDQIAVHEDILRRRPPDRSGLVARASDELARTRSHRDNMVAVAAGTRHRRDQLGPLTALRRGGREERRRLDAKLAADLDAAHQARLAAHAATEQLARLRADQENHQRFESEHGWRRAEVIALRDRLAHHWTEVVTACVAADDPLAYGIDKLRASRHTVSDDLGRLNAMIPPDRSQQCNQTRRQLTTAVQARHEAHRIADDAVHEADLAGQRRWGRRDQQAIARANARRETAEARFKEAVKAEGTVREQLAQLTEHEQQRRQKLDETHQRRVELNGALENVDTALTDSRSKRVRALAAEPPEQLINMLGPVPKQGVGREAWLHLADKFEAQLDQGRTHDEARRAVCGELRLTPRELSRLAERIAETASRPAETMRQTRTVEPAWQPLPQPEIGRGIERGIGRELSL